MVALPYRLFLVFALLGLWPGAQVIADEIRPALLDIKEQNTGLFAVTWKVPTRNNQALAIVPRSLSENRLTYCGRP